MPLDDAQDKMVTDAQASHEAFIQESRSLLQQIQSMTVSEKVKFALHAGKDARSILIRDTNEQVAMAVLNSPKITEEEILQIAQSRNISDNILRAIAKNRDWTKKYPISIALVNNPKTPIGVSLNFLPTLKKKDLMALAKNRNVGEALRTSANRLLHTRQDD
jgi:2,3-bisphosphoglycerate-independent phosphoglycerate mutase